MTDRRLLTDQERLALLGIPLDADSMARCFTLSRADQELVAARRRDANRIGFAVQLALLRHPGIALVHLEQPVESLVQWLARHAARVSMFGRCSLCPRKNRCDPRCIRSWRRARRGDRAAPAVPGHQRQ